MHCMVPSWLGFFGGGLLTVASEQQNDWTHFLFSISIHQSSVTQTIGTGCFALSMSLYLLIRWHGRHETKEYHLNNRIDSGVVRTIEPVVACVDVPGASVQEPEVEDLYEMLVSTKPVYEEYSRVT